MFKRISIALAGPLPAHFLKENLDLPSGTGNLGVFQFGKNDHIRLFYSEPTPETYYLEIVQSTPEGRPHITEMGLKPFDVERLQEILNFMIEEGAVLEQCSY